jgi:DNA-dependent RNA polymerase
MTMQLFTGKQYLQIDIANNFGLDKEDWDNRLDWFLQAEGNLEHMVKDAEEPALFYVSTEAYRKAQRGEAIAYPISLDATASGLQILAALTGCRKSALLCNVLDAGKRMDAYTALYKLMLQRVGDTAKIERADVKKAVMTAFYASKAVPKRVFGEGELLQKFYETVSTEALSNDWVLPDGFHVHIKVMDSVNESIHFLNEPFDVSHRENMPKKEGRSLPANATHSIDGMVVREMNRRCNYNPVTIARLKQEMFSKNMSMNRPRDQKVIELWKRAEESGFLSARILGYLDRDNAGHVDPKAIMKLIQKLPKRPFEVLSIHDCFRCLPNYGNDLRTQYNTILSEIAGSNLLAYLVSQILGKTITVRKYGEISNDILQTNYALS